MPSPPPTVTVEDLPDRLPKDARLVGLDLGTKTIGVALSDAGRSIATAQMVIRRAKFRADAAELLAFCSEHDVGALVLGLPVNMNGSEGPRAQATRAFARNLSELTELPIALWDERLSTAAAERAMIEADMSRKKRAARIDAAAAAFILQGALDRLTNLGSNRSAISADAVDQTTDNGSDLP